LRPEKKKEKSSDRNELPLPAKGIYKYVRATQLMQLQLSKAARKAAETAKD